MEPAAPQSFELLFEDPHLLAVNKPSGLPTLPGGGFLAKHPPPPRPKAAPPSQPGPPPRPRHHGHRPLRQNRPGRRPRFAQSIDWKFKENWALRVQPGFRFLRLEDPAGGRRTVLATPLAIGVVYKFGNR